MAGIFDPGIFDSGIFDTPSGSTVSGSFTADAVLLRIQSGSFTADAALFRTQTSSFTADAVLSTGGTISSSFTADAVLKQTIIGSLTEDAIKLETIQTYAGRVFALNPVHYWRLNEASGNFADSAGTNTITPVGGWTYNQTGATGDGDKAILGSSASASMPIGNIPTGTNARSVSFIYKGTSSSKQTIISYGSTNTRQAFSPALNEGGSPRLGLWSWADDQSISAPNLLNGSFHHIVYTMASGASSVKVYFDGALLGTLTFGGGLNTSSSSVRFGGDFSGVTNNRINGTVDELFITASELTPQQISALYAARATATVFTGDAVLRASRSSTKTADAILRKNQSTTLTADAVLKRTISPTFTADASIFDPALPFTYQYDFTADAAFIKLITGSLTADAVLKRSTSASFTADARFSGRFTADAIIMPRFTADALLKKTQTSSFTADAVFRFTFLADAVINAPQTHTFKADAWFRNDDPEATGNPNTTPYLSIMANGVDITDDVRISDAVFTTSVQGRPGSFHMSVKDADQTHSFTAGTRITVDIDGYRYFDGYAQRVSHQYAFDVVDATNPDAVARIWELEGPDLNILFLKRFVFDQVDPNRELHIFAAGADDDDVVRYYFNHYLALDGDDLNYSGVEFVGSPNPDHAGAMANIGDTWAQAMAQIAAIPGAIWGLRPDRTLYYADTDTESANFRLSDTPNQSTTFGYSDFEWAEDANKMVNDAQVWGAGQGSNQAVYAREVDATSVSEHGLWQLPGQWRYDVYRQVTADQIADSIVQGSTVNHHGAKDPALVVKCRVKKLGLLPGDRVHFTNNVFGVTRVLPIRRLTVRFVSRYSAYFDLELSQEIDPPWSFAEFPNYNFKFPRYEVPVLPPITWPPGGECVCGITDTFDRVTADWGYSDYGTLWTNDGTFTPVTVSCDGNYGSMVIGPSGGAYRKMFMSMSSSDYDLSVRFNLALYADGHSSAIDFVISTPTSFGYNRAAFGASFAGEGIFAEWWDGNDTYSYAFTQGVWYTVRMQRISGAFKVKVWPDGDTEPGWLIEGTQTSDLQAMTNMNIRGTTGSDTGEDFTVLLDNLDITDVNRCTAVQFDDFNRTVSSGLGVSTPGGVTWTTLSGLGFSSVNGTNAVMRGTTGTESEEYSWNNSESVTSVPWLDGSTQRSTTMRLYFHFFFSVPGAGAGYVRLAPTPGAGSLGNNVPFINVSSASGNYGFNTDQVSKHDWVSGVTYIAEWDFNADTGTTTFVVYQVGTTPGTLSSTTLLPSDHKFDLFYTNQSTIASSSAQIYIDSIDFDYSGRPCYFDCTQEVLDSFDGRTTTSPDWGLASSGFSWTVTDNGGTVDVTGNEGHMTLNSGGANALQVAMLTVPDYLLRGQDLPTMLVRFKTDTVSGADNQNLLYFGPWNGAVQAQVFPDTTFGYIGLFRSGSGLTTFETNDWIADTWYFLKYEQNADGSSRSKYWADGDTEPDWQVTTSASTVTSSHDYFLVAYDASGGDGGGTVDFDYIEFSSCNSVTASGTTSPSAGGYGCEVPIQDTATVFHTSFSYVAGTLEVYRNGVHLVPGVGFTETTPSLGIFTFATGVTIEEIYVCYNAGGAPTYFTGKPA